VAGVELDGRHRLEPQGACGATPLPITCHRLGLKYRALHQFLPLENQND
jgi:hypothetical protein